jgi:hypothetical protein
VSSKADDFDIRYRDGRNGDSLGSGADADYASEGYGTGGYAIGGYGTAGNPGGGYETPAGHGSTVDWGNSKTVEEHKKKLSSDPVTGELGELGFGTQPLPVSGRDIQDEKVLGTLHVATGRSDHLGGHLTPDKFANQKNATHDDILFAPHKTPEIEIPQVRMYRNQQTEILIENFVPAPYMAGLLVS